MDTDYFQCIYLVAQSRPCIPMLLQPYNIWTLIISNVFILLRSHGHASRCYCSHIIYGHWLFPMYLSCCAVTAMHPDVTAAIWTLIISNVFILLRSHGHASRCYCSNMDTDYFQCIYLVAQSRPCVPMLLQP